MKIGAICSAGGGSFLAAVDMAITLGYLTPEDVTVITDRSCSVEPASQERGLFCRRIDENDNAAFSAKAFEVFSDRSVELVLLFFTRLISADLHEQIPTLNIHPSLLPAFPGFGALNAAQAKGARFLGATLHIADNSTDGGQIIGQIVTPIRMWDDVKWVNRLSHLQKIHLALSALELFHLGYLCLDARRHAFEFTRAVPMSPSANPALICAESQALYDSYCRRFNHEGPIS